MPKPARTEPARAPGARPMVRVWDPLVRLFHWSLVAAFVTAWLTPHGATGALHQAAGLLAAGLVALRILWGFVGSRHARFADFVRPPRAVLAYLGDIAAGREARFLGHNPAGGAMVLALMAGMLVTALTGWMMTTDRYFGVDWVEELHSLATDGMAVLVLLHVGGVILATLRHRESLVRAMVTGLKRP